GEDAAAAALRPDAGLSLQQTATGRRARPAAAAAESLSAVPLARDRDHEGPLRLVDAAELRSDGMPARPGHFDIQNADIGLEFLHGGHDCAAVVQCAHAVGPSSSRIRRLISAKRAAAWGDSVRYRSLYYKLPAYSMRGAVECVICMCQPAR